MAYWHMTKKVVGNPALEPGEQVVHAVYGIGRRVAGAADTVSGSGFSQQFPRAAAGDDPEGFAALTVRNGALALTDRRLLFFPKATVVGKPKQPSGSIPRSRIVTAAYAKPMLTVTLDDGSVVALHVPRSQHPDKFVNAVTNALL